MKSLVIYDSKYGNTEIIAQIIKHALDEKGEVQISKVAEIKPEDLPGVQLMVVGSPTQQFRATLAMRSFLAAIPSNGLKGIKVAAFDTRLTQAEIDKTPVLAFFVKIYGYAAGRIARQLKKKGGELVLPAEGFLVEGMEGPLVKGEVERAEAWAKQLIV